jgi:hypothetical protein
MRTPWEGVEEGAIYFIESSVREYANEVSLCAVESAARFNPNRTVILVLMYPFALNAYKASLNSAAYVQVIWVSYEDIAGHVNKEFQMWVKSVHETGPIRVSHFSDIMRFSILLTKGGMYLDSDMITLRSVDNLQDGAALEMNGNLGSGVLITKKKGSTILKEIIDLLPKRYDMTCWGCVGPPLIQEVVKKYCQKDHGNVTSMETVNICGGWTIYPKFTFFPVYYVSAQQGEQMRLHGSKAYTLHLYRAIFNNQAKEFIIANVEPELKPYLKHACPNAYLKYEPITSVADHPSSSTVPPLKN